VEWFTGLDVSTPLAVSGRAVTEILLPVSVATAALRATMIPGWAHSGLVSGFDRLSELNSGFGPAPPHELH